MRRALRIAGTLLIVGGVLTLGWAVLVWQWQDPFTALYTHVEQQRLAKQFDRELAQFHRPAAAAASPAKPAKAQTVSLAALRRRAETEATADRRRLHTGDAVGRLTVGRLGLKIVVVQGTDEATLKKGPGHYAGSYLPGQGKLIYIAGHRTTYLAPFSHIDRLRAGDWITLQMPYGTFKYVVTRHRIVPADDLAVLKSSGREVLVLQACHPRFFATHRYLVYARPAAIDLGGGEARSFGPTRLVAARGARAGAGS